MIYSEVQNGEFSFGFQDLLKKVRVLMMKTENKLKSKKKNNKRDLLEVSGYWAWDSTITEGFQGSFPRVGEDDI